MSDLTVAEPAPVRALIDIQACYMPLYPCRDSLVEAVQYIESQLEDPANKVFPLLMVYHNSLIKALCDAEKTKASC